MNIKNLIGATPMTTPITKASPIEKPIKSSESSAERDANGQEFYSKQRKKEKMSDEQFEKAIALLKEKQFIKDMNWVVEIVSEDQLRFAWVKDQAGETIRRIAEYDLWDVFDTTQPNPHKGQLLKRSA